MSKSVNNPLYKIEIVNLCSTNHINNKTNLPLDQIFQSISKYRTFFIECLVTILVQFVIKYLFIIFQLYHFDAVLCFNLKQFSYLVLLLLFHHNHNHKWSTKRSSKNFHVQSMLCFQNFTNNWRWFINF